MFLVEAETRDFSFLPQLTAICQVIVGENLTGEDSVNLYKHQLWIRLNQSATVVLDSLDGAAASPLKTTQSPHDFESILQRVTNIMNAGHAGVVVPIASPESLNLLNALLASVPPSRLLAEVRSVGLFNVVSTLGCGVLFDCTALPDDPSMESESAWFPPGNEMRERRLVLRTPFTAMATTGNVFGRPVTLKSLDQMGLDVVVDAGSFGGDVRCLAAFFASFLCSDRVDGLFPSVVVDVNAVCLGLVYSSVDSISCALEECKGIYYSRSRYFLPSPSLSETNCGGRGKQVVTHSSC